MKNSTFLKDLFAIDKANDELFRLVGVAICMAIPLLIGYFSNNLLIGTFGSMGIYTFIYYQPLPLPQLLRRLNIVGFFIVLGNSLGMLSHHVPWLIPITIAIVAFLARLLFRLYGIEKPGALLVIMSTAMGTSNSHHGQFCSFRSSDRHYHGHCASFHRQAPLRFSKTDVSSRTTLY